MPTFDVDPTTIPTFEIDNTYLFTYFFEDQELVGKLKVYYKVSSTASRKSPISSITNSSQSTTWHTVWSKSSIRNTYRS